MALVLGTIILRPYVFIFLVAYLGLAAPAWGWRRTGLYLVVGYAIAWLAEYSSVHNGFPFGPYYYISTPTLDHELWVGGVPFMDSLSFVFVSFAGLQTARLILQPLRRGPAGSWDLRWECPTCGPDWQSWALGGLLTMGLDVVIDPVALQGSKWFLGQICGYPSGGVYFGVPLANFAGWALVSWAIVGAFLTLDRRLLAAHWGPWRGFRSDALGGAALFAGVLAFNLLITFAIGETRLGIAGCAWSTLLLAPISAKLARRAVATASSGGN